jgi:peptidoglycan hydrolase-like protein with peptidoglycan-binding domain
MVLKRGDNNEIVKKIQVVLGVDPIGTFGPKTEEAVKAWQTKNGLKADGVVRAADLAKMGITVDNKPVVFKALNVSVNFTGIDYFFRFKYTTNPSNLLLESPTFFLLFQPFC